MLNRVSNFLYALGLSIFLNTGSAHAFQITNTLEAITVSSVGTGFQTVTFQNTYTLAPVVVCTGQVPNAGQSLPVIRLQNVSTTSMQIRVQKFNPDAGYPNAHVGTVYCLVSEIGSHTLPDGKQYQAEKVGVTGNHYFKNWANEGVNVTNAIDVNKRNTNSVILAQIMTSNDVRAQVPLLSNCESIDTPPAGKPPFFGVTADMCVGRHTGNLEIDDLAGETVGYIVAQPGTYNFLNTATGKLIQGVAGAKGAVGDDGRVPAGEGVKGIDDTDPPPPYIATTPIQLNMAVATEMAQFGNDGTHAGFYGTSPLTNKRINMVLDETHVDSNRKHTDEMVGYFGFRESTLVTMTKTVDKSDVDDFDVLTYTIEIKNESGSPLSNITLTDSIAQGAADLSLSGGPTLVATPNSNDGILSDAETWQYTATYQTTEDNFQDGNDIVNSVYANVTSTIATTATQLQTTEVTATTTLTVIGDVTVEKTPTLKNGDPIPTDGVTVGQTVTYTYIITNTGNYEIDNIAIVDTHLGTGDLVFQSCSITETTANGTTVTSDVGFVSSEIALLGAKDVATCTADYVVTQADIDNQ